MHLHVIVYQTTEAMNQLKQEKRDTRSPLSIGIHVLACIVPSGFATIGSHQQPHQDSRSLANIISRCIQKSLQPLPQQRTSLSPIILPLSLYLPAESKQHHQSHSPQRSTTSANHAALTAAALYSRVTLFQFQNLEKPENRLRSSGTLQKKQRREG